MMKIVALMGSPRKQGNTASLLEKIAEETVNAGAQLQIINLNELKMKGCQSCYACKSQKSCVLKDDAQEVLESVAKADRLIFATPVYMWDMTAQLKRFVDRLFCFSDSDYSSKLEPGKKILWAITQGQSNEELFLSTFEKHGKMLEFLGFGESRILIAGGNSSNFQPDTLKKANDMAKWLISKE